MSTMKTNKQQYNTPTTTIIEVEGGYVMLGMSDNGQATDIQAPRNFYPNWEEEEETLENELLRE